MTDETVERRAERSCDHAAIAGVVRRADAAAPYRDHGDFRMMARLREGDPFVPELPLVAERDATLAGHEPMVAVEGSDDPRMLEPTPLSGSPEVRRGGA